MEGLASLGFPLDGNYLLCSLHISIYTSSSTSQAISYSSLHFLSHPAERLAHSRFSIQIYWFIKGWVKKQRLYNFYQRNPRMLAARAGKLLWDPFLCWLFVFVCSYGRIIWKSRSDFASSFAYENSPYCRITSTSSGNGAMQSVGFGK